MKAVKKKFSCTLALVGLLASFLTAGPAMANTLSEIPKGTIFKLRHALEVPANQDFLMLGKNVIHEAFNSIDQYYNSTEGRYYYNNHRYPYFHYTHYEQLLYKNYLETYNDCLERHRQYSYSSTPGVDNVIVNQGSGNTNVIINNGGNSGSEHVSYIGDNLCVKPSYTYSFLLIDKDKAEAGGIFRDGYEFKVKAVKIRHFNGYSRITILFDHDIAKGVVVLSTEPSDQLYASQLEYDQGRSSDGFWASMGTALSNLNGFAGNYFEIYFPESPYFD